MMELLASGLPRDAASMYVVDSDVQIALACNTR